MTYEDYSPEELIKSITDLFDLHSDKLVKIEVMFLNVILEKAKADKILNSKHVTGEDRDLVIGIYNRLEGDEK